MPKYQIRFCDSKGNGSFEYFEATKNIEKKAAEKATEYLVKSKERQRFRWPYSPYKSKRIVHVWELDKDKKQPKKGGHRFKLQLYFFEATYNSGRKERKEWYEPIEN